MLSSVHVAVVFGFVTVIISRRCCYFPPTGRKGRFPTFQSCQWAWRTLSTTTAAFSMCAASTRRRLAWSPPRWSSSTALVRAGTGTVDHFIPSVFFLFLSVVMIVVHVLYCLTKINISWQGRSTQVQEQSCWPCHYRAEVLLNTDMNWRGWWQGSCWGGGVECFVHHHSSCWHSTACFIDTFSWRTHFVTCAVDIANLFHWSAVWNNHPSSVWHAQTLPSFKSQLKTRLFSISYS